MLTEQQSCLLRFIESRLADGDVSPSFEEMRLHLGLRSKSGVHRLLEGLRERGCVVRLPHRARSLRVVRRGENHRGDVGERNVGGGNVGERGGCEVMRLPFLGGVAAGLPIEAVGVVGWNEEREYPSELLGRGGGMGMRVETRMGRVMGVMFGLRLTMLCGLREIRCRGREFWMGIR